ncbi:hypothetical protein Tco_0663541 [Tanacetum coccineum]
MLLTARKRVHPFLARILANRRRFHSSSSVPPRVRLRDPSSTYCHEVSVEVSIEMDIEDSIETRVKGDIKRDTEGSHEADTQMDIDSDILADIEADIAAEAAVAIETDVAADTIAAVEEGSNIGLRDALGVKREMAASLERHLGYMLEELRRIRLSYQYDREDFRRLETFTMRRLGYRP